MIDSPQSFRSIEWQGSRGVYTSVPATGSYLQVVSCTGRPGWVGAVYLSGARVELDRRRTLAEAKVAAEKAYRGLENAFRDTP